MLDSKLSWREHITHISKKVSKSIGILHKARKIFSRKTVLQLYFSFIYPLLLYANIIWGNCCQNTLWPLYKLQKRAIRLITNARKYARSTPLFLELKLLKLPEIYTYSIAIFMHKYHQKKLPSIFNDFFETNSDYHNYNTRSCEMLRPPIYKSDMSKRFLKRRGVELWNTLSSCIIIDNRMGCFKKQSLGYLLSQYI